MFRAEKGRQIALSVAQENIKILCGEEVSMACSINNVLIETAQKYLSNLKQFGIDDKKQRNHVATLLAPFCPERGMTATCFMSTFGISRNMIDQLKRKKLEFYTTFASWKK